MSQHDYNSLAASANGQGLCVRGATPNSLPGTKAQRVRNGFDWPTPYKMLEQWCQKNLRGKWAIASTRRNDVRGFQILMLSGQDLIILQAFFKMTKSAKGVGPCAILEYMDYGPTAVAKVAKSLGYVQKRPSPSSGRSSQTASRARSKK